MNIIWNKNPLWTTIELTDSEKVMLWFKIKVQQLEHMIFAADYHIRKKEFEKAKLDLNWDYVRSKDGMQAPLDQYCDAMFDTMLEDLSGVHVGDCTCVPCTCTKCCAEELLGVNTLEGLGKHEATKFQEVFGQQNERTIEEAIAILALYDPGPCPPNWETSLWESCLPRWRDEAGRAYIWLTQYCEEHFKESTS